MNYKKIKEIKAKLRDLFISLSEALNKEGVEIDQDLEATWENIVAEKFLLAIVGEVKAGKSTFINAILGEAILPAGNLQATSEIVEIYRSDKMEVQVTFANGKTQVEDNPQMTVNEVAQLLKKVASVKEKYRNIPTVQVHKFLLDHYSKEEEKAVFEQKELKSFTSNPELENIHKLDQKEFRTKICEYIDKNISCDKIPKMVTLGYPHDFSEFNHFRIVDTPGIYAIGGIEERTKEFINKADAVIYLHNASQLESTALRNALKELPEKVKDRLILVLTHRREKFRPHSDDHEEILEEAKNLYPEIGSDKIFFVDSLTELYLKAFSLHGKSMNEINDIRRKNPELQDFTANFVEKAGGNKNILIDLLEKQSNFMEIREKIEGDSIDSASFQMMKFASTMQGAYENVKNNVESQIAPLKSQYKDPQIFASKIRRQIVKKEKVERDYNEFEGKFNDDSWYSSEMNSIERRLLDKIEKKRFEPNDHNPQVEDYIIGELHEEFLREMNNLIGKLNKKLEEEAETAHKNVGVQIDCEITVPTISLGTILDTAKKLTEKEIQSRLDKVEKGLLDRLIFPILGKYTKATEDKIDKIERSFPIHYWEKLSPELENLYTFYWRDLSNQIDEKTKSACEKYRTTCHSEVKKVRQELDKLEDEKKRNKELGDKIFSLEEKIGQIKANIQECIRLRAQL